MFKSLDEVLSLQLDHTSRCNLACPQCARMERTVINPMLNIGCLTLDDYKLMLAPFKERKLKSIFHCGNFGDVIASPTFDETFDYSLDFTNIVKIATNGSARTPQWWKSLAERGGDQVIAVFAIDGLKDTNHLYRINSNYDKVIENAQAFIDAGGRAEWEFIEFEHNYHQIEEANKIANDMGFSKFSVKYTSRFAAIDKTKVTTKRKTTIIEKKNHNNVDKKKVEQQYETFDNYTNKTDIVCKFQKHKRLFIDMNMKLWPCCWFGSVPYAIKKNPQRETFDHFLDLYGHDFNDMRVHGWDVLNHEFFQKYLYESWTNPTEKFKRIYTCGRTCGNGYEFSSGYGKNIKTV